MFSLLQEKKNLKNKPKCSAPQPPTAPLRMYDLWPYKEALLRAYRQEASILGFGFIVRAEAGIHSTHISGWGWRVAVPWKSIPSTVTSSVEESGSLADCPDVWRSAGGRFSHRNVALRLQGEELLSLSVLPPSFQRCGTWPGVLLPRVNFLKRTNGAGCD